MWDNFSAQFRAIGLRQEGKSYAEIQKLTGASLSNLSYWFRKIKIPDEALRIIKERKLQAIGVARAVSARNRRHRHYPEK